MRIRSIKPEFWRSEDIAALDIADRLLFIGLWSYVDDSGVGLDRLADICADLFALDLEREFREDSGSTPGVVGECYRRVRGGLRELSRRGLITRYVVDGVAYLHITTWARHQRIEKPAKPRYPAPTCDDATFPEYSGSTPGVLPEMSVPGTGEQGNRGTEEQGEQPPTSSGGARTRAARAARATRLPDDFEPTPQMLDWARTEAPHAGRRDHEQFCDYWRSKSGKDATKVDWVAAWRKWMRTESDRGGPRTASTAASRPNSAENRMLKAKEVAARLAAKHAERTEQPALTAGLAEVVDLPTFGAIS